MFKDRHWIWTQVRLVLLVDDSGGAVGLVPLIQKAQMVAIWHSFDFRGLIEELKLLRAVQHPVDPRW